VPIDVLKAVATLTVVWIHTAHGLARPTSVVIYLTTILSGFAVPGFFFAAGFLRWRPSPVPVAAVRRWIMRLLSPYLVASAVWLIARAAYSGAPIHARSVFWALVAHLLGSRLHDAAARPAEPRRYGRERLPAGDRQGGVKYLLSREKVLEKCGLAGGTSAICLADLKVQVSLAKAAQRKDTYITKQCGNRDPVPSPPFCCRTGPGNQCTAAASRDDCEDNLGGNVQEGKTCNAGNCDPTPGSQTLTWWGHCPESETCPGAALSTLGDLIACVDASADAIVDELLCFQFPTGWPCPPPDGSPSGAFLDAD
jgi:hypothetical protein